MSAPRIRNRVAMPDVSDARHIAVFHLAPLDSLATKRRGDDFAEFVVVALVEILAFTHGFVAGARGAQ